MDTPAEIEAMLRDTGGVVVTMGDVSTWGHLDTVDELVLGDEGASMMGTRLVLMVATGVLPPLRNRTVVIAAGTPYAIREHGRDGDGALSRLVLTKG